MNAVLISFPAIICAVLQMLLPRWGWTGSLDWPVLSALLMVIVLHVERRTAISTGVLTGLLYDVFSPAPLGLSLPFFLAIAVGLHALKSELFSDHWITYFVLGPAVVTLKTVYLFAAYSFGGLRPVAPGLFAARLAAGLLLGALTASAVYFVFSLLKQRTDRRRWRRKRSVR